MYNALTSCRVNAMNWLRFVWTTVSDCRKQTGPPDAGNNLRKSHFIMCHVTKYSTILGVFQQPWPGVSPTAILNEEKALRTRLQKQVLFALESYNLESNFNCSLLSIFTSNINMRSWKAKEPANFHKHQYTEAQAQWYISVYNLNIKLCIFTLDNDDMQSWKRRVSMANFYLKMF